MKVEVIPQAPQARCYLCGKPDVKMVCHHCGRAICGRDGPAPAQGRIATREFARLDLGYGEIPEIGVHCKHCAHPTRSFGWLIALGILMAIIGVALTASGRTPFLVLILVGIGVMGLGVYLERRSLRSGAQYERPPLPVIGKVEAVTVTETVRGKITLDKEGKYRGQVQEGKGRLMLIFQFIPRDRERRELYLKKYRSYPGEPLSFHAGFAVLRGMPDLAFDAPNVCIPGRINTIALVGKVDEQPFLRGVNERDNRWTVCHTYTLPGIGARDSKLLVQVLPILVQGEARKMIELVVQFASSAHHLPIQQASIEELTLRIPQGLGRIENVEPAAISHAVEVEGVHLQEIVWRNVDMTTGKQQTRYRSFYLRFENAIEPTTVFQGRLRVRCNGTLSGLEDVTLFYPLGNERHGIQADRRTYMDIELDLHLGALRFQDMELMEERIVRQGVVPDHRMVTALTNALSGNAFYVKRVIENPPRTDKAGAHIVNRYWDVAGRFYEGVYPIDFHLVLTGKEEYGRDRGPRTYAGETRVDVTVQGMVTDEEMRDRVEYLRDSLTTLIDTTLEEVSRMQVEAAPAGAGETPVPSALEEFPEAEVVLPEEEEEEAIPIMPQPDAADRALLLRKRLEKLDDALLEGRISEARYEEMRARIEQELAELYGEA